MYIIASSFPGVIQIQIQESSICTSSCYTDQFIISIYKAPISLEEWYMYGPPRGDAIFNAVINSVR